MNYKNCWIFIIGFIFVSNVYGAADGGLCNLFRARNESALVYRWAKESRRDSLRAFISFGCSLGVFNYLRGSKNAGKLMAFIESAGFGTTIYQILGLLRKITINPLARLLLWTKGLRQSKLRDTQDLFDYIDSHRISSYDQLPSQDHIGSKAASKMMVRLRKRIHNGGIGSDSNWVDRLMIREQPAFVGAIPDIVRQDIDYIRDPARYVNVLNPRRGLLLLGAPGNGKTTLAKLIAYHAGCPFKEESPAAFANTYIGTGPNRLKAVFEAAEQAALAAHKKMKEEREREMRRQMGFFRSAWEYVKHLVFRRRIVNNPHEYIKPTILCLNEIDTIGGQRGAQVHENQERVNTLDQLFNSMDTNPHVFVVGTSNRGEEYFDEALRRDGRMGRPVTIPLPDARSRFDIVKYYMRKMRNISPEIQIPDIEYGAPGFEQNGFLQLMVGQTDGLNGNQLRALFNNAGFIAGDRQAPVLGREHFEQALHDMRVVHEPRAAAAALEILDSELGTQAAVAARVHNVESLTP